MSMQKIHLCQQDGCPHVVRIKDYARGCVLADALVHVRNSRHRREQCRYGPQCFLFQRNCQRLRGDAQNLPSDQHTCTNDEAHCHVWHHTEDMRTFENAQFRTFQPIPRPLSLPDGGIHNLETEAHIHSFGDVFTTLQGTNLNDTVRAKLRHPIHLALGSPLSGEEVLAVILYTGTNIQPDFNKCHREGDFEKWKTLFHMLQTALGKLHQAKELKSVWRYRKDIKAQFAGERVSDLILRSWDNGITNGCTFTYVKGSALEPCPFEDSFPHTALVNVEGINYLAERVDAEVFRACKFPEHDVPVTLWRGNEKTRSRFLSEFQYFDFLSTSTSRRQAEEFLGTGGDQGILFALERDDTAIWADISWISKYPDEQEILFGPTKWRRTNEQVVHTEYQGVSCLLEHYELSHLPSEFG